MMTRPTSCLPFCSAVAVLLAVLALAMSGCGSSSSEVNTVYGRRSGKGATSVNGTSVLARMFHNAGHRVKTRGRSGGNIEDCDVIVWAPDRFTPPTDEEREEIYNWINDGYGRTFIYIGRDYDAAVEYWNHAADAALNAETSDAPASADTTEEYLRRRASETSRFETARANIPDDEDVAWFTVSRDHPNARVTKFDGPWSRSFDPEETEIWTRSRFEIPTDATAERDPYFFDENKV